jgi:Phospholipase_D-nuclease N-terminal
MHPVNPMEALAALLGIVFLLPVLTCGLMLVAEGFWIWMLVDCATNQRLVGNEKTVWVLVVIFTNWLGALIYFFAARQKRFAPLPGPTAPPAQSQPRKLRPVLQVPPAMPDDPIIVCPKCGGSAPYSKFAVGHENLGTCPLCFANIAFE